MVQYAKGFFPQPLQRQVVYCWCFTIKATIIILLLYMYMYVLAPTVADSEVKAAQPEKDSKEAQPPRQEVCNTYLVDWQCRQ